MTSQQSIYLPPHTEAQPTPAPYVKIVDALRGFAALGVCLVHYTEGMLPKLVNPLSFGLFFWGGHGVTMFFAISGFVIPFVLLRRNYTYRDFGKFIGKRFIRIDPPSYISMVFNLMQWAAIDLFFHSPTRYFVNITPERIFYNLTYLVPFVGGQELWINGVFWTLSVEYQYYFVIALILPLLTRNRIWLLSIGVVLCALPYALRPIIVASQGVKFDMYFFTQHAPVFWMGILTAFSLEKRLSLIHYLAALAVLAGVAWHQAFIRYDIEPLPNLIDPVLYALFGLVTALLIRFVSFSSALTTFLGSISYSLYLTHGVVGTSMEVVLLKLMIPASDAMRLLYQVICLLAAIGFAYLFCLKIERPFVKLAGRLVRW
jgi:peptidoglycan/LPS O-acetylase OafA/YrhL